MATDSKPSSPPPHAAARTAHPRSLSGLSPFLRPYRVRILLAVLFLLLAALTTLAFPLALRGLIDQGFIKADPGERVMALRDHFLALFGVGAALYVLAYLGFAVGVHAWWWLLIAFTLAGSAIGLAETAESTLFARALPDRLRGSGFGVLGAVQAAGDLVSTAVTGVLYATVSPAAGFAYAAGWMLLSLSSIALLSPHTSTADPAVSQ